jgi:hypothetical protein
MKRLRNDWILFPLVLAVLLIAACTSSRYTTHTQKSGTEQLLVSRALERALGEPPSRVRGAKTAIEVASPIPEMDFLIRKGLEHWLLEGGAILSEYRTDADYVVSVMAKAVGTDGSDYNFGIPPVPIPLINWSTPPVTIFSGSIQRGYAEMDVFLYPIEGGLSEKVTSLVGKSHYKRFTILLVPITFQNIYKK